MVTKTRIVIDCKTGAQKTETYEESDTDPFPSSNVVPIADLKKVIAEAKAHGWNI